MSLHTASAMAQGMARRSGRHAAVIAVVGDRYRVAYLADHLSSDDPSWVVRCYDGVGVLYRDLVQS